MENEQRKGPGDRLLKGWREIARHFGRDQSTVRRWAAEKQLPVYRAGADGGRGIPVHAFASELDAWLRSQDGVIEAQPSAIDAESPADEAGAAVEPGNAVAGQIAPSRRLALIAAGGLALAVAVGGYAWWWNGAGNAPTEISDTRDIPEEAHRLYLRGSYLWNRRTPESIAGAIKAFEGALKIYPDYAEAYAGLAMTYNLARQYSGMSGFEAYPKAEKAARRAVALDPTLDLAQSALAFIEFNWIWDVKAGLARFREAVRLNPDSANTLSWYASCLIIAGRANEALPVATRAQELNPASSSIYNIKALALFHAGQTDAAIAVIEALIERDPGYAWSYSSMASIALAKGDYQSYLENYARLGDLIEVPRYRAAASAGMRALASGGPEAMAAAMFDVDKQYYDRGEALAWNLARDRALVGRAEEALRWLRISFNRHEERLIGIKIDPAFWPIRDDPGYAELLSDIGLPPD